MNAEAFSVAFDGSMLRACEEHADTPDAGLRVFTTYVIAQVHGWTEARRRVSKSTWYRHKDILKRIGIFVPSGVQPESAEPHPAEGAHWFGAMGAFDVAARLADSPNLISQLVNCRFRVALPWKDKGMFCTTGRHELEAWPVGSEGVICSIIFDGRWVIEIEHDDGTLPDEERWPRVPLAEFLRRTQPLEEHAHD